MPSRRPRLHFSLAPSIVALAVATTFVTCGGPVRAVAPTLPSWLVLRAGAYARVDVAPWIASDEPEAALVASAASLRRDFTADAARPGDVTYEPIGVRVRVVRLIGDGVALVHGAPGRWQAYAPTSRLVPDVPPGTRLRVAGGFGGFADYFPTLSTRVDRAGSIATGSEVLADGMGVGPYDPQSSDLVRVRVRVRSGALRGRVGYVPVAYTGIPGEAAHPSVSERACACRLSAFDDR